MKKPVLYLTADGLLEPLGFSQVVRVVEALAQRGFPYEVVSLEKPNDLRDERRVRDLRARLSASGVRWDFTPYLEGSGATQAGKNELALVTAATTRAARGHIGGVHARSYHGAMAAFAAWVAHRVPYLFDTRSYWFDERLEEGRWLTSPLRVAVARGLEHQLYAQAAGVVTLTELHADDVRGGRFGPLRGRTVRCIPTCADFDEFFRRAPSACASVPLEVQQRLADRTVIGIVGSINRSYLVDESIDLARRVLSLDPSAHLLILSKQRAEYLALLSSAGIKDDRFSIRAAPHEAMAEWLSLIDWGLMLLQPNSPAKRASMPTKLAEYFACEVRPIAYGGNSEIEGWVAQCGSGLVLGGVSDTDLSAAADHIARSPRMADVTRAARQRAAGHFALESGVVAYEETLAAVFSGDS